jgi:FtsZ-binding cell division protein ZapB
VPSGTKVVVVDEHKLAKSLRQAYDIVDIANLKGEINVLYSGFQNILSNLSSSYHERDALKTENDQLKLLLDTRTVPGDTPPIVCLCGSTRFMDAFFEAGWKFTLQGRIVLSVGVCKHAEDHGGEALGQDVADRLDELHLKKIDLADSVFVLNVGGYIGDSTRKEIEYAKSKDKPIEYLESVESAESVDKD